MSSVRRIRSAVVAVTGIVALLAAVIATEPAQAGRAPARQARSVAAPEDCSAVVSFHSRDFPRRPKIDNRLFPLARGTELVLSGTVREDDGRLHPHKIVTTVSEVTKVLDGVRTLVVFERDIEDGQLQESELAFEAQDRRGTVWNIGEYPEEYEDGTLIGADTWISGIARAQAGVAMLAHPRVGTAAYLQGVAPGVGFRDCATVARTRMHRCEPSRCYRKVLVIDEFSPLDPDSGHQLKYYVPQVGAIEVGAVGGSNPEVLHLTSHRMLGRAALAKVNRQVLAQDVRGYRVSPRVYGRTPRAELAGHR